MKTLNINETRALLMALLADMPLGPMPEIADIDEMTTDEKLFMLGACCTELILESVWALSRANKQSALQGVDDLMADIRARVGHKTDGSFA